jgi:Serine dehydrogenase proteinase
LALSRKEARDRQLFVLVAQHIDDDCLDEVYRWRTELKQAGEALDILIHSPGGVLNPCYQVARLLSRRVNSWEALIPSLAASGATLISLGSSNIIMSEVAVLGPIDPQVISKRHERFFATERQSPLEAFQAVRYLREFALTSLDANMKFLFDHHIAPKPALETAATLAFHLVQPVLSKIEPYDLGAFALDSNLALEYCQRVARPADQAKKTQRGAQYRALVEKYPAHEFVVDIEEARALGFQVADPEPQLDALFDELRPRLDEIQQYIGLVPNAEVTS